MKQNIISYHQLSGDISTMVKILRDIYTSLKEDERVIIHYSQPQYIHGKKVMEYIIPKLFISDGERLCYAYRKNARWGYAIYEILKNAVAVSVIKDSKLTDGEFSSFQEFRDMFDPRFISEEEVRRLYEKGSTAYNRPWRRSDFRKISGTAAQVMKRFLEKFVDIYTKTEHYKVDKYSPQGRLDEYHKTWHHAGRDITVSHDFGKKWVSWSSEFQGCGNGDYYLVADKNTVLFIESD